MRSLVAVLFLAAAACHGGVWVVPAGEGRLLHAVAFWFKPGTPAETSAAMVEFYRTRVPQVEGVEWVFAGTPAGSTRNVVDGSYAVHAVTLFRSRAAEQGWQVHPIHDELKRRFDGSIERVVVHDSVQ